MPYSGMLDYLTFRRRPAGRVADMGTARVAVGLLCGLVAVGCSGQADVPGPSTGASGGGGAILREAGPESLGGASHGAGPDAAGGAGGVGGWGQGAGGAGGDAGQIADARSDTSALDGAHDVIAPRESSPEPVPEAGPEPRLDAGPEPKPEAGPEPQPEAGPSCVGCDAYVGDCWLTHYADATCATKWLALPVPTVRDYGAVLCVESCYGGTAILVRAVVTGANYAPNAPPSAPYNWWTFGDAGTCVRTYVDPLYMNWLSTGVGLRFADHDIDLSKTTGLACN
jgi:hypothetical protein